MLIQNFLTKAKLGVTTEETVSVKADVGFHLQFLTHMSSGWFLTSYKYVFLVVWAYKSSLPSAADIMETPAKCTLLICPKTLIPLGKDKIHMLVNRVLCSSHGCDSEWEVSESSEFTS